MTMKPTKRQEENEEIVHIVSWYFGVAALIVIVFAALVNLAPR